MAAGVVTEVWGAGIGEVCVWGDSIECWSFSEPFDLQPIHPSVPSPRAGGGATRLVTILFNLPARVRRN